MSNVLSPLMGNGQLVSVSTGLYLNQCYARKWCMITFGCSRFTLSKAPLVVWMASVLSSRLKDHMRFTVCTIIII